MGVSAPMGELAIRPDDIVDPDPWPVWSASGYGDDAAEWSMRDATKVTRGKAHAAAARDLGWTEVRVWKRYIRLLTRQESWEYNHEELYEGTAVVPDDWRPDEGDPVWEFVHRGHPDARPYWVVGERGDVPPPNPGLREEPADAA